MKKTIAIQGMSCMHCVAHVEKALKALPGTASVKVDLKAALAVVDTGATDETLRAAVEDAGYTVTVIS